MNVNFDKLLEDFDLFLDKGYSSFDKGCINLVKIKEDDTFVEFKIELPGFEKDEIKIDIENGTLLIDAKNDEKSVSKRFYIRDDINTDKDIDAKLKNGILTINFKKNIEKKRITIQ